MHSERQRKVDFRKTVSDSKLIRQKTAITLTSCSDGFFDRDGWLARTLTPVPLVGFVVAIIHELAGNSVRISFT